jgi:WD40 repeat protein
VFPDGKVATGSLDKTVRVYQPSGSFWRSLHGHKKAVNDLCVLPDGLLASSSDDRTVCVWKLDTGECMLRLEAHTSVVRALALLTGGTLVSCSETMLYEWDLSTGELLGVMDGHTDAVTCIQALTDNRVVSGAADTSTRVWRDRVCLLTLTPPPTSSPTSGGFLFVVPKSLRVLCLAPLPENKLATGCESGNVYVWDLATGALLLTNRAHASHVTALDILPDGTLATSSYCDKMVRLFSADGQCKLTLNCRYCVNTLNVLPDGNLVTGSSDLKLRVWNPTNGACVLELESHADGYPSDGSPRVVVLPGGQIASALQQKQTRMWRGVYQSE